jgi:ABC-type tungstate transport system substrate-binding protein
MILANAATALGGFGILLMLLVFVILAVLWLIFPFVVASGLNALEKLLRKQNDLLSKLIDHQNETNKALQWLVDNWSKRP